MEVKQERPSSQEVGSNEFLVHHIFSNLARSLAHYFLLFGVGVAAFLVTAIHFLWWAALGAHPPDMQLEARAQTTGAALVDFRLDTGVAAASVSGVVPSTPTRPPAFASILPPSPQPEERRSS